MKLQAMPTIGEKRQRAWITDCQLLTSLHVPLPIIVSKNITLVTFTHNYTYTYYSGFIVDISLWENTTAKGSIKLQMRILMMFLNNNVGRHLRLQSRWLPSSDLLLVGRGIGPLTSDVMSLRGITRQLTSGSQTFYFPFLTCTCLQLFLSSFRFSVLGWHKLRSYLDFVFVSLREHAFMVFLNSSPSAAYQLQVVVLRDLDAHISALRLGNPILGFASADKGEYSMF